MPFLERLITRLPAPLIFTLSFRLWPRFSLNDLRPRSRRLAFELLDVFTLPAVRSSREPLASCVQDTRTVTTPEPLIVAGDGDALQGLVLMIRSQSPEMSSNVSAAIWS